MHDGRGPGRGKGGQGTNEEEGEEEERDDRQVCGGVKEGTHKRRQATIEITVTSSGLSAGYHEKEEEEEEEKN